MCSAGLSRKLNRMWCWSADVSCAHLGISFFRIVHNRIASLLTCPRWYTLWCNNLAHMGVHSKLSRM